MNLTQTLEGTSLQPAALSALWELTWRTCMKYTLYSISSLASVNSTKLFAYCSQKLSELSERLLELFSEPWAFENTSYQSIFLLSAFITLSIVLIHCAYFFFNNFYMENNWSYLQCVFIILAWSASSTSNCGSRSSNLLYLYNIPNYEFSSPGLLFL